MAHSSLQIRSRVWPQSAWPLRSHSWLGFSGSYSVSSWRSRAASVVPPEVGHGALSPAHEYGIGGAVDMLVPGSRSLSRMWEGAILAVFVMSREWQESTSQGETRAEPEVSAWSWNAVWSKPGRRGRELRSGTKEEHAQSRELGWGNNPWVGCRLQLDCWLCSLQLQAGFCREPYSGQRTAERVFPAKYWFDMWSLMHEYCF